METSKNRIPPKVIPKTDIEVGHQRPHEFGDFDKRAEALELDTLIKGAILKVQGYYKQYLGPMRHKLIQFLEIMKVFPDEPNQYRLPYYQIKIPYSATAKRNECVLAVVAALIEAWWGYQRDEDGTKDLVERWSQYLIDLSKTNIIRERIYGDLQKGYYLWKDPFLQQSGKESSSEQNTQPNA
jgi:hypothetical protein